MTPEDLPGHTYLNNHRADWQRGEATLRAEGWPWWCSSCDTPSFLCYRCSKCGRDLTTEGTTSSR